MRPQLRNVSVHSRACLHSLADDIVPGALDSRRTPARTCSCFATLSCLPSSPQGTSSKRLRPSFKASSRKRFRYEVVDLKVGSLSMLARQVSITRNTVSPQVHEFVMQGMQTLYLAYRPNFYSANGRYQLILSVELASSDQKASYQAARQGDPSTAFIFRTSAPTTIEDILSGGRIVGDIVGGRYKKCLTSTPCH